MRYTVMEKLQGKLRDWSEEGGGVGISSVGSSNLFWLLHGAIKVRFYPLSSIVINIKVLLTILLF